MTLTATRMTALTLARTGCPGIRAMIGAIVFTAFRHAFPRFNFAVAAGMSAFWFRHFHHLLSYNLRHSSISVVLPLLE